jgi:hypothetical protein
MKTLFVLSIISGNVLLSFIKDDILSIFRIRNLLWNNIHWIYLITFFKYWLFFNNNWRCLYHLCPLRISYLYRNRLLFLYMKYHLPENNMNIHWESLVLIRKCFQLFKIFLYALLWNITSLLLLLIRIYLFLINHC